MKKKIKNELKYRKRKKLRKIIVSAAVTAGVIGFGVWFALLKIEAETKAEKYDFVIPYEKRDLSTFITSSGKIEMADADVAGSDVTQRIKKIYFNVGDYVNEGDTVIEFDGEMLDENIQMLQKNIDEAENIKRLRNSNEISEDEYYRKTAALEMRDAELMKDETVKSYEDAYKKYDEYYNLYYNCEDEEKSRQYMMMYKRYEAELDGLRTAAENAENNYLELKESINKAESEKAEAEYIGSLMEKQDDSAEKRLAQLKDEKSKLIVKAPRSGVISDIYVSEGSVPGKSDLFKVGSLEKYKIKAYISTKNILDVKEGMDVEFTTTLTGDNVIKGKIVRVSDIYDYYSSCYTAEIEIEDTELVKELKPNISAFIKIMTRKTDMLYSVPYDAVVTENEDSWVYIVENNGNEKTAKKVKVKTGMESSFYTEITESELKPGDLVICDGKHHSEGERIKIRE